MTTCPHIYCLRFLHEIWFTVRSSFFLPNGAGAPSDVVDNVLHSWIANLMFPSYPVNDDQRVGNDPDGPDVQVREDILYTSRTMALGLIKVG